jgi:hypothetical protein
MIIDGGEVRDRDETVQRIVGQLVVDRRHDAHDRGADQQGVAVRPGLDHELGGDVAGGAGLVFDHDLLA